MRTFVIRVLAFIFILNYLWNIAKIYSYEEFECHKEEKLDERDESQVEEQMDEMAKRRKELDERLKDHFLYNFINFCLEDLEHSDDDYDDDDDDYDDDDYD